MIDFFSILAATDPNAASGGIVGKFGIHVGHIVMQGISFSLLAYILYRFAFKPVFATMDERNAKIADGLKYADDMKAQLEEAEQERKEIIQKASQEAQGIVNEAKTVADEKISNSTQEAIARA